MIKMTHGSAQDVYNSGMADGLALFDYKRDNNDTPESSHINNGNDSYGPGIYANDATGSKYQNAVTEAGRWTGKDSGFIYVFNVDVDEDDLINEQEPDAILAEEWADVIEHFLETRRSQENFCLNKLDEILSKYEMMIDEGQEIDLEAMQEELEPYSVDVNDDSQNPKSYEDGYEWRDYVYEHAMVNDPYGYVEDQGGSKSIAQWAINSSDDLWETLMKVWQAVAVHNGGMGQETFNRTFQNSVFAVLKDKYSLKAARVNQEASDFLVVFDTDEIQMEKVIDVSPSYESNMEY